MRLVVVYSVEKIRIRNRFDDDVFDWYQQIDHEILNSAERQVWLWYGQKLDHPLANSDLRDRVVYELRRYFWNYYQFGFEPNNTGLFNHLRIEKHEVVAWLKDCMSRRKSRILERSDRCIEFERKYNICSFLYEDQLDEFYFTYLKIESDIGGSMSEKALLDNIIKLIRIIPYYSPYAISVTELESFTSGTNEKQHFSVNYSRESLPANGAVKFLPLDRGVMKLIDVMFQFIFQHIHHQINLYYFGLEHDPLFQNELRVASEQVSDDVYELAQTVKILESMYGAISKSKKTIYTPAEKKVSLKVTLHNLVFYNFKYRFHRDKKKKINEGLTRAEMKELNVNFFDWIPEQLKKRGVSSSLRRLDPKADEWKIVVRDKERERLLFKGSMLRKNFASFIKEINELE